MIFDELFAGLDGAGDEDVGSALLSASRDRCVFIISHSERFRSYANIVYVVKKENEITTLTIGKGGV